MATEKGVSNFTTRDMTLLVTAMRCTKSEFTIDYAKFAEQAGFANANSAKASWHSLKKKLDKAADDNASTDTTVASPANAKGSKGGKKRKATAETSDQADEVDSVVSPVKNEHTEDGDEIVVTPPISPAKKGRKAKQVDGDEIVVSPSAGKGQKRARSTKAAEKGTDGETAAKKQEMDTSEEVKEEADDA